MTKLKNLILISFIILLGTSGMLFGCDNKFSKMSLELDTEELTLYLNPSEIVEEEGEGEEVEEEEESAKATVIATINDLPSNTLNSLSYSVSNDNIVLIDILYTNSDNETTIELTAYNAGSTVVTFITEEGNKKASVSVNVISKIEEIAYNGAYNQIFEVGVTSGINVANALIFGPEDTNQKDVTFSLDVAVEGLTVSESGMVTAEQLIEEVVLVRATSTFNEELTQLIPIKIIEGFTSEDVNIFMDGSPVWDITLSNNNVDLSSALLEILLDTPEPYKVYLDIADNSVVEVERKSNSSFMLRSTGSGQLNVKVYLELIGYEYYNIEKEYDLNVIEFPSYVGVTNVKEGLIDVSGNIETEVLDNYIDNLGKPFTINVGAIGAYNKDFRLYLRNDLGLDLVNGGLVDVTFSDGALVDFSEDLPSGITIFVKGKEVGQSVNLFAVSSVYINEEFPNNIEDAVKTQLEISLNKGATSLVIDGASMQLQSGTTERLTFSALPVGASLQNIFYDISNNNIIEVTEVKDGLGNVLEYSIKGVGAGNTRLTLTTANGITDNIEIEVYNPLNDAVLSLPNPEIDSRIGELLLKDSVIDNNHKTLDSVTVKVGAGLPLDIVTYPTNASIQNVIYSSSDETIASIGSNGYILAGSIGTCTITVVIQSLSNEDDIILSFEFNTYMPIDAVELNFNQASLLDGNELGFYDEDRSKLQLDLSIVPVNSTFNQADVVWSKNNSFATIDQNGLVTVAIPPEIDVASTTISATIEEFGRYYTQSCVITIRRAVRAEYISIENLETDELYFDAREGLGESFAPANQFVFEPKVYPVNTDNQEIVYKYIQQETDLDPIPVVIIEDDGTVTPRRAGNAVIKVIAKDSFTDANNATVIRTINVKVADGLTPETALQINNASDLFDINTIEGLKLHYVLNNTIDLSGYTIDPIGIVNGSVVGFSGSLVGQVDENNDPITNIIGLNYDIISTERTNHIGLFASLTTLEGNIGLLKDFDVQVGNMNIRLESNSVNTVGYIGALVAENASGTIQNVEANIVNSLINTVNRTNYIGGLVGYNSGNITYDSALAAATPTKLFGVSARGQLVVESAVSTAKIYAGGIAGYNLGTLESSFDFYSGAISTQSNFANSTLDIYAVNTKHPESAFGGIAGYNIGTIQNMSAVNNIEALNNIGGAIGINASEVNYLYASSFVKGETAVGGLVGKTSANINNSIVEMLDKFEIDESVTPQIIGINNVGGLVGTMQNANINYSYVRSFYTRALDANYEGDLVVEIEETQVLEVNVGGLVGLSTGGQIKNSYAHINVAVNDDFVTNAPVYVGGVVGYVSGLINITDVYSKGNYYAEGTSNAAGIVGYLETAGDLNSMVVRTYSVNWVNAGFVAGVIAEINDDDANPTHILSGNLYWDNVTSANAYGTAATYYEDYLDASYPGTLQQLATFTDPTVNFTFGTGNWGIHADYNKNTPYLIDANDNLLIVEPPTSLSVTVKDGIESLGSVTEADIKNTHFKIEDKRAVVYYYEGSSSLNLYDLDSVIAKAVAPVTANIDWISLSSSDITKLRITENNKLQILDEGLVKITVTSLLNKQVFDTFEVMIIKPVVDFEVYKTADTTATGDKLHELSDILGLTKDTIYRIYPVVSGAVNNIDYAVSEGYYLNYIVDNNLIANVDGDVDGAGYSVNANEASIVRTTLAGSTFITVTPKIDLDFVSPIDESTETRTLSFDFLTKQFTLNVVEGSINLSLSTAEASISPKDIFIMSAVLETDIPATSFILPEQIDVSGEYKNKVERLIDGNAYSGTYTEAYDDLNIQINNVNLNGQINTTTFEIELADRYDTDLYNEEQVYKITFVSYDNADLSLGKVLETQFILHIVPQDVLRIDMNYYSAKEIFYDEEYAEYLFGEGNGDQPIYNPNELPSGNIITGKIGILKLNVYPSFASQEYVDLTFNAPFGTVVSFEQVAKVISTGSYGSDYTPIVPQAEIIEDGVRLRLISNYVVPDVGQAYYEFNGSLYVHVLIASGVEENSEFTLTAKAMEELEDGSLTNILTSNLLLTAEPASEIILSYDGIGGYFAKGTTRVVEAIYTKIEDTAPITVTVNGMETTYSSENGYEYKVNGDLVLSIKEDVNLKQLDGSRIYKYYNVTLTEDADILDGLGGGVYNVQFSTTKTINNKLESYKSNEMIIKSVEFTVESFRIKDVDESTNYLVKPYGGSYKLEVIVTALYDESNPAVEALIDAFELSVSNSINTWYETDYGQEVVDIVLDPNTVYENFSITNNTGVFIVPEKISINDLFTAIIKFNYEESGSYGIPSPDLNEKSLAEVGIDSNDNIVLRESFKTEFYLKASEDLPVPIYDEAAFLDMKEGANYILMDDITLGSTGGYVPMTVAIASLDGNNKTITIQNFADGSLLADDDVVASIRFGLFSVISESTIIKNVNVDITGLNIDATKYQEVIFGGIAAENDGGIIYNCNVYSTSLLEADLVNISTVIRLSEVDVIVNVGGIVGINGGHITNSRSSVKFKVGHGYVGGFASVNNGIIASSYYKEGSIIIEKIATINSSVGGFVATNNEGAEIRYSYAEGAGARDSESRYTGGGIQFSGEVGGFVHFNDGIITDAYSNITIDSQSRSAGFVYINEGNITNTYSLSLVKINSAAHTAFIGIDENGHVLNNGQLENVYFGKGSFSLLETQKQVDEGVVELDDTNDPDLFAGFSFSNVYDEGAVWKMNDAGDYPVLVSADNIAISMREIITNEDGTYDYLYPTVKIDDDGNIYIVQIGAQVITYDPITQDMLDLLPEQETNPGSDLRPIIVYDTYSFNNNLTAAGMSDIVSDNIRLVKSFDFASEMEVPTSISTNYTGILDGNGMTISGVKVVAGSETIDQDSIGLFKGLISDGGNKGIVKNLKLYVDQVFANKTTYVGALAGIIDDGSVYNLTLIGEDTVIEGGNLVGGIAGKITGDSEIVNITANISVNSGFRGEVPIDNESYITNRLPYDVYYDYIYSEESYTDSNGNGYYDFAEQYDDENSSGDYQEGEDYDDRNNNGEYDYAEPYDPGSGLYNNLFYDGNTDHIISYAGVIAGVIDANYTSGSRIEVKNINVFGNSRVIAENAGGVFGLIGRYTDVENISLKVEPEQFIRGVKIMGGIVAENRGIITNARIENIDANQIIIDAGTYGIDTGAGNKTFFAGRAQAMGGIIGYNPGGILMDSYSKIDVYNSNVYVAGGLVGRATGGTIMDSYATGSVMAAEAVGGILGQNVTTDLLMGSAQRQVKEKYLNFTSQLDLSIYNVQALNNWLVSDYEYYISDQVAVGAIVGTLHAADTSNYANDYLHALYDETINTYINSLYSIESYNTGSSSFYVLNEYGHMEQTMAIILSGYTVPVSQMYDYTYDNSGNILAYGYKLIDLP